MSSSVLESCGSVIFSSAPALLDAVAVVAFVTQVAARFHAAGTLAEERDRKPLPSVSS